MDWFTDDAEILLLVFDVFEPLPRGRRECVRPQGVISEIQPLRRTALGVFCIHWIGHHVGPLIVGDAVQNVVRRVLNAGIRLVELASSLGGDLAEHITVLQGM
jgi:hypothetical protein